jgi:anti-sigma B factor antagonist
MPGGLRSEESRRGGATVLEVDGELDLLTAPRLRVQLAELVRRSDGDVVVDMRHVAFIDSTGLAAMLNALRRLTRARRRLVIVCDDGPVLRVLRMTRLERTFTVCESIDDALATVGAGAHAAAG